MIPRTVYPITRWLLDDSGAGYNRQRMILVPGGREQNGTRFYYLTQNSMKLKKKKTKLGSVYFWNFLFNIFRPQLTVSN